MRVEHFLSSTFAEQGIDSFKRFLLKTSVEINPGVHVACLIVTPNISLFYTELSELSYDHGCRENILSIALVLPHFFEFSSACESMLLNSSIPDHSSIYDHSSILLR